jgi:Prp8 binding protein
MVGFTNKLTHYNFANLKMNPSNTSSMIPKTTSSSFPFGDHESMSTGLSAPTMRLSGHTGSVYTLSYDPTGTTLASGSFDKTILLWNIASGLCENFNILDGHKNAILDLKFSSSDLLLTASADKTLGVWDVTTGTRIKKCTGHTGIVNSLDVVLLPATNTKEDDTADATVSMTDSFPPNVFCSASDDATVKMWDIRVSRGGLTASIPHDFAVTGVAIGTDHQLFSGGIDNKIYCWDVRHARKNVYTIKAHSDTITYLSIHPKTKSHLLSNSMDQTVKSWDVRHFVQAKDITTSSSTTSRHDKTFLGATHNAEKALLKCSWSGDGTMVTAGSADNCVHIWDVYTTEELYLLPGHSGTVHTTIFHPLLSQQIASGSSDKTIYVGELG